MRHGSGEQSGPLTLPVTAEEGEKTGRFPGDFQAGSRPQHSDESAFWLHPRSPAWEMSPSVALWQLFFSVERWLCCQHSKAHVHYTAVFKTGQAGVCLHDQFVVHWTLSFGSQLPLFCFSLFLPFALIFKNQGRQILAREALDAQDASSWSCSSEYISNIKYFYIQICGFIVKNRKLPQVLI